MPELIHSEAEFAVDITVNDPDVFERVIGPNGDEWRSYAYDLRTKGDVVRHLTFNAIVNGVEEINKLDGWADLPDGACTMRVIRDANYGNWNSQSS